jgi:hypothetical protein
MQAIYEYRDPYVRAQQWYGNALSNTKWDNANKQGYIITREGVRKNLAKGDWVVEQADKHVDVYKPEAFRKLFKLA